MPAPDDFGTELGTRIALHEMLIKKLFVQVFLHSPNGEQDLEEMRQALSTSFEVEHLSAGHPAPTEHQAEQVRQQSVFGKELVERFAAKVGRDVAYLKQGR